jgi:hypothetical protein
MELKINPIEKLTKLERAMFDEIPVWPETRSGNSESFVRRNAWAYREIAIALAAKLKEGSST